MKHVFFVITLLTLTSAPALALEPIPGSLIFPEQPRTKLVKAPIGSTVTHEFKQGGRKFKEIYVIQKDRSLKLAYRSASDN